MARLLLVDDDAALLDVLSLAVEESGHEVLRASDGAAALEVIRRERPALVICDINLPRIDGFTLLKRLRDAQDRVPFIALTSRDSEVDEALGLELGADDYVSKPFSTRVLLARVQALLRREQLRALASAPNTPLTVGKLTMDPERFEVTYAGCRVEVTVTEFKLLEALVRRPGVVCSRERLLFAARGDDSVAADRVVDTYVRRLRRKLEAADPTFEEIQTVTGAGYRWRNGDG